MGGYNYQAGMSNNAVAAYEDGLKPLSNITTRDLKEVGINISKSFAVWLAKNNYWKAAEWHHSGGSWYNEVNFYNPADLAELINDNIIDLVSLKTKFLNSKKDTIESEQLRVYGTYTIWGGSRNYPRKIGEQKFTGIKIGDWIYLDNGGKKRCDGNYIEYHYEDKR